MGNSSTRRALIVGGGIAGMSTAITLGKIGVAVDLIDLDPQWRVYGAGISITGPTLRAFGALGILDAVRREGFTGDGIQVCDAQGQPSHVVPTPIVADGDVPGSGGIMRPVLHRILSEKTLASGAQVRLGLTVDALHSDAEGVTALMSDGTSHRYDLVVGADGVFSKVRRLLFPEAPGPVYTGQCVWRVTVPRQPEVVRRMFFLGGPVKVGLTPVSRDEMYMFVLETGPKRPPMPDE
jgi:2-polyprenyl-6-methoxyphenol hydroxylase-like FAD-dependent oxidoreductase